MADPTAPLPDGSPLDAQTPQDVPATNGTNGTDGTATTTTAAMADIEMKEEPSDAPPLLHPSEMIPPPPAASTPQPLHAPVPSTTPPPPSVTPVPPLSSSAGTVAPMSAGRAELATRTGSPRPGGVVAAVGAAAAAGGGGAATPAAQLPTQPSAHGSPTRVYLNQNVTPHLLEGMKKLALLEPEKPLKWLSDFLAEKSREYEGQ